MASEETRTANVELTADVQQYNQQVATSVQQTNKLTESVNKLVSSLDGITKRAGKKLLLFSAADAAAMTAYTVAAAKYEKQLSTLRAQTELSGRSMDKYKRGMEDLSRQLPITGREVASLVTQINQLGITSENQATRMARTFTQLAAATGEDIGALTQGLIELSRQMGTLGNGATGVENFADSLTSVSNSAGVSATAVLSFASAIAPMARAAGIGQKEVLGISTAFTKAGADGFAAANTFNSMVTDITRSVMNGSPELAKYAAAIGATTEQFTRMDETERIVQIFEAITKAGPDAVKLIDRLGYDGIRAAKSIQAVANESGGLRKAINEAVGEYGSGSTAKGANAAFDSMDSQMTRFRNNLEQIAATIGSSILPVATQFMEIMNSTLDAVNKLAGPLLQIAGAIGGIVAPLAAAFGGLMTMMGPLSSLMIAMTLFRLSPMRAMFQGVREGANAAQATRYSTQYVPTTSAGTRMMDGRGLPIYQRAPYRLGEALGSRLPVPAPGPNPVSQVLMRGAYGASELTRKWYIDPTKVMIRNAALADPLDRDSMIGKQLDQAWNRSQTFRGTVGAAISNPWAYLASRGGPTPVMPGGAPIVGNAPIPAAPKYDVAAAKAEAAEAARQVMRSGQYGPMNSPKALAAGQAEYQRTLDKAVASHEKLLAEHEKAAKAIGDERAERALHTRTMGEVRSSLMSTGRAAMGMPLAYGAMGTRLAGQGIARLGGGLLSTIGGMVGGGAGAGAGLIAAGALAYGVAQTRNGTTNRIVNEDTQTNLGRTNAAIGQVAESLGDFNKRVKDATDSMVKVRTVQEGYALSIAEASNAATGEFKDARIGGLTDSNAAVAFLKTMGEVNAEQARSLAEDMAKEFGAQTARLITDTVQKEMGDPLQQTYGEIGDALFKSAAKNTDAGFIGGIRNTLPFVGGFLGRDDNTNQQVEAAWVGLREQATRVGAKYGPEAEAAKRAADSVALLGSAFNLPNSAGSMQVTQQSIKQWEALYGELGLTTDETGIYTSGMRGSALNTSDDFLKYIFDPSNTSDGAVGWRRSLMSAGLGASDFIGPNKKNADELAISMMRGNLSDYEKRVRSTDIGSYARERQSILDVTEGTKVGDMKAVGAAVNDLYEKMTKGGTSFDTVTEQAYRLAQAAGSASDPLYQLAMAAKDLAYTRGLRQATNEGGMVASISYRLQQNSQAMREATSDTDINALRKERDALEDEGRAAAVGYLEALRQYETATLRAREDFHRSMLYQEKDFAKSMTRAAEDAARSIYSPFQRVFSSGTIGSDQIVQNMKDQNRKIAEQMKNLAALKKMGLSQDAIDMMNLTDPTMSFQVERMLEEGGGNISAMNKQAGRKGRLARDFTQNPMNRDYRRTIEDYETSRQRAEEGFQLSLDRSAEDMRKYGREVYGNLETVLDKVQRKMNKVMPGVESPFYKKLVAVAEAITGQNKSDVELGRETFAGRNRTGAEAGSRPRSTIYDPLTGEAYYTTGQGTRPYNYGATGVSYNADGTREVKFPEVSGPTSVPVSHNAAGGVVRGMTLAMMGEMSHPEVIVPLGGSEGRAALSYITDAMVKSLRTAGHSSPMVYKGGSTHIVNNNNVFKVEKVVADDPRAMAQALREEQKRQNMRLGANA